MNSNQLNKNEYAPFYKTYIKAVGTSNLFEILTTSLNNLVSAVKNLPEEKLEYRYAKSKWTIKELIQHIIDTERIMCYRALRFSRNDKTDLPGFEENWYVENSNGNERTIQDLLNELTQVRNASISLFNSFTDEMPSLLGTIDGNKMSVRALGFIIAGHQIHHLKIIKERYL
ncbi:MAG: DUF664 domain-containing protein [Lutibacter sp.]|uniref:DinB family protein n=1 Tax=Lutibacter sp. TaxID=1925666 RepID=UPI001A038F71|nr:DinB family protein [Lutibacter sp.]NOR28832.1 DUF664 domain-containing protein [Lutibacter sp.]